MKKRRGGGKRWSKNIIGCEEPWAGKEGARGGETDKEGKGLDVVCRSA